MKTLYILSVIISFLHLGNYATAQIDQTYFYDNGFTEYDPRTIEPTNDGGYIVSGIISYNHAYIMKVDSAFEIQSFKEIDKQVGTMDQFSENLTRFTDSSFLLVHGSFEPNESNRTLSLFEIDDFLNVKNQVHYDLGFEISVLNSIKLSDNNHLIGITGSENLIISVDSLLQINWSKSYNSEGNNYKLKKLEYLNDSLIFTSYQTDTSLIFSTLTYEGEMVNSVKVNSIAAKSFALDIEVSFVLDTLCIIFNNEFPNNLHFLKLNSDLEIYNEYIYEYRATEFVTRSNVGFIRNDTSGFIFYAGNTLFHSSRNHEILAELGDYITFKDYYISDTTTLLLVKNGLTPVKNVAFGSEFVILAGNSIDSIMKFDYFNECLYMSYIYSLPTNYTSELFMSDIVVESFLGISPADSIHLIDSDIFLQFSCPSAPSAVENSESFSLDIYPNPAYDVLHISADKGIDRIVLYSVNGSLIESRDVDSSEVNLNVYDLNSGMYFLGVYVGDEYVVRKIVVE